MDILELSLVIVDNGFTTLSNDLNERQATMDPRARLLQVVIQGIEFKQNDPTAYARSLGPDWIDLLYGSIFSRSSSSSGDPLGLALEIALLDARALYMVMRRVEKNDNLREVFLRAFRSIREAILHAFSSYPIDDSFFLSIMKRDLANMAASAPRPKQEYVDASESDSELAIAYTFHALLTSVLHLLTSVFQYLTGYVDRGGSKTYSSGAFDFRASFVSLVLFQGAYVWIKFRQAARPGGRKRKAPDVGHEVVVIETCNPKGVYARPIKDTSSGAIRRFKHEPRFTPPRQEANDDTDIRSKRLPLGEYHTRAEALIVLQIAQYYYDEVGDCVELEDGRYKFIPPMSEEGRGLAGKEKRKWVTSTAKQVGKQMYADFRREKGKHLDMASGGGSHGAEFNDPSSSALPLTCLSLPMLSTVADAPAIASTAPSSPSLTLLPFDGAVVRDAYDSSEALSGYADMLAELVHDTGLPNLPDQQLSVDSYQMHYQGFAQLLGDPSLPEVGAVPGGIEHGSGPILNPSPRFQQRRDLADAGTENIDGRVFLQQGDRDLQQLVSCQKKWLEDNARQFVDLNHQLKVYQIQNSRLQEEKEQFRTEIERLRTENESLKGRWTKLQPRPEA